MVVHDHLSEGTRATFDLLSVGVVVGTLVDMLPSVAAGLTIVWTAIRIWETDTVQRWFKRKPKP